MPNYQTLKGFRDFLPAEKRARDFVANKIKTVFETYGFEPIETPTLEYASLLLGKYGDEADKLVYKFMDRGEREVALRYDQTVPTARVLAQYQNELPRFFRRYQIQNVFRADKPQKRRYREFTQCDADIFNSKDPIADAEILAVFYSIYQEIGLTDIQIQVNDRQTLISTLAAYATETVGVLSIIQSIDKLDKVSPETVVAELVEKGLTDDKATQALESIQQATMSDNLERIITAACHLGVPANNLAYFPTLARGLDYYTGIIFEAKLPNVSGSLGAGGRYDNLIHELAGVAIPAVGFGLGFDRTVELAIERNLISQRNQGTKVLISLFDAESSRSTLTLATRLRQAGIATEAFPGTGKLDKQLKYADQKQIPVVLIQGPDEINQKIVTIKDMRNGTQKHTSIDTIVSAIEDILNQV